MKRYISLFFLFAIIANCMIHKNNGGMMINEYMRDSLVNWNYVIDSEYTIDSGVLSILYRFNNQDTLYNNRYRITKTFKEDFCMDCDTFLKYFPAPNGLGVVVKKVIFDYEWWPNGQKKINNKIVHENGKIIIERLQTDSFGNNLHLSKYVFYKDTVIERFGGSVSGWFEYHE